MFEQLRNTWKSHLAQTLGMAPTRSRAQRRKCQPQLELLEERVVPVVEIYTIDPNLDIDQNNGLISKLDVTTSKITALIDVDVFIRIDHTWQGDLSALLTDGTKNSVLLDRVGATGTTDDGYASQNFGSGSAPNFNYLILDDQAATNIHFFGGTNNITGSFQPDNNTTAGFYTGAAGNQPLSNFNGLSGNRTWQLKILDHFPASDGGKLISWGVRLTGNDPPTNVVVTDATTNENQSVTVSGKFDDPNTTQTHTVNINWGDGSTDTKLTLAAGVLTYSAPHTYADDDPTATASDKYTVTVTVTDTANESATGKGTVTVNNVAPSALNFSLDKASYNEGELATLGGSFTDPGINDTFTVAINWGDGSAVQTFTLGKGVTSFAGKTHAFGDDSPTGTPSDLSKITVTVTDDDTGTVSNFVNATVNNIAPSALTLTQTNFSINEGGTFTLAGTFSDPGLLDVHTVEIDWDGNGTFEDKRTLTVGDRAFSLVSPVYPDDFAATVKVRVGDDDTAVSATVSATLKVNNVIPSNIVVTGGSVNEGSPATISGKFDDPGLLDTHTVDIDWDNNGTFDQTLNLAAGVTTFTTTGPTFADDNPTNTPFDPATIRIRVTDKDAGQAQVNATLTVNNIAPANLALTLDKTTLNEGQAVTLGGTFFDPSALDTFTVVINWGDGSANTTVNLVAGKQSFAGITHTYRDDNPTATPSDPYTISVTVTDDDTGSTQKTAQVTVNNLAPTTLVLTPDNTTIAENGSIALTGSFTNFGDDDTHVVVINWGDGSANTTLNLAAGTFNFNSTHKYLDDSPSGTASDKFTISVTVTDDDTGSLGGSTQITVNNVAPGNLVLGGPFTINENDSILLAGTFTDPGTLDPHTVTINWGDGTAVTTLNLAAGVLGFNVSHQYLDDNPTGGSSDNYTISVTVTDDDLGTVSGTSGVTVNNVAPGTVTLNGPFTINENGSITLTGSFVDPGSQDSHSVEIDWDGDGTYDQTVNLGVGARSFSASHKYLDDNPTATPSDTNIINVRVTDDDTGVGSAASAVTINNVAPAVTITGPANVVVGVPQKFVVDFTDLGTLDTHELSINWGDGNVEPFAAATSPTTLFHSFTTQGKFTVTFSVRDDDTGLTTVTHNVNVGPIGTGVDLCDPTNLDLKSLYVSGTDRNDVISFVPNLRGGVSVILNGRVYGPFFPNTHLVAFGLGGNDRISVHPSLAFPAIFYGGAGNDVLVGSRGGDLLFGQDGNDTMIGGHGRDVLIGGFGADTLYGHYVLTKPFGADDQDLLVGNATVHDTVPVNACGLIDEWLRTDLTFEERRERIRVGEGGIPALNLQTIIEDNATDRLFSVRSTDWLVRDAAGLDRYFGPVANQLS